ncbi:MAG: hypothetical protein NVSMB6_28450 [Burkholderiaceae bacterium]
MAAVRIDGKWGYIDHTGKVVIQPKFELASAFFNGMASIMMGGKYGYIDKTGTIVVAPKYGYAHFFLGEIAEVALDAEHPDGSGSEYINRSGRVIWKPAVRKRRSHH